MWRRPGPLMDFGDDGRRARSHDRHPGPPFRAHGRGGADYLPDKDSLHIIYDDPVVNENKQKWLSRFDDIFQATRRKAGRGQRNEKEQYFRDELPQKLFIGYAIIPSVLFTWSAALISYSPHAGKMSEGNRQHNQYVAGELNRC